MRPSTAFIQLGRAGDIINVLPAIRWHHENVSPNPVVVTSPEYAGVLDGVSYATAVTPWQHTGRFADLLTAFPWVQSRYNRICCCQVYGTNYPVDRHELSFTEESWRRTGTPFEVRLSQTVFDRRDSKREEELFRNVCNSSGKIVLLNLGGVSSPMRNAGTVRSAVMQAVGNDARIVDLSTVKAERIFDLLGLYERASLLITSDTATLHLAAATPDLPVIALITDGPTIWHGSHTPAVNRKLVIRYCDFEIRRSEFSSTIWSVLNGRTVEPKFLHVYQEYDTSDEDTLRRMRIAARTWEHEKVNGLWDTCGIHVNSLSRTAADIGDDRGSPYVKDMFDEAVRMAAGKVVVFTNSDINFTPGISHDLESAIKKAGCVYAHRWDFGKLDGEIPKIKMREAKWYPGSDLFAFTPDWWMANSARFPDMIVGYEGWDKIMRETMLSTGGCEIHCAISHQKHGGSTHWESRRFTAEGNKHNIRLARKWLKDNGKPLAELDAVPDSCR